MHWLNSVSILLIATLSSQAEARCQSAAESAVDRVLRYDNIFVMEVMAQSNHQTAIDVIESFRGVSLGRYIWKKDVDVSSEAYPLDDFEVGEQYFVGTGSLNPPGDLGILECSYVQKRSGSKSIEAELVRSGLLRSLAVDLPSIAASPSVVEESHALRKVFGNEIEVAVPKCWKLIESDDRVSFMPDLRKCPTDKGAPFDIQKSKAEKLRERLPFVDLVVAKDASVDATGCLKDQIKIEAKHLELTIACGHVPEATSFSASVVCGNHRYEILKTEYSLKFDGRTKIKPDDLPDKPYKTAFKTLRCDIK